MDVDTDGISSKDVDANGIGSKDVDGAEMREVTVRTGKERCTLVVDLTINTQEVEAVVDSGAQVSVLSKQFYDSLCCRPRAVETIRLKGASSSGEMVGCRIDGVDVDLKDGHGSFRMTMYVADISDNCILGLDYLKARGAVIDLGRGVLVVEGALVPGRYRYARGTAVINHKVRLINDYDLFPNSVSRVDVRIRTDDVRPLVIQARRKGGQYLVPNTLIMSGESNSLYVINDSDEHVFLNEGMVVALGQDVLQAEEVSEGFMAGSKGLSTLRDDPCLPCDEPEEDGTGPSGGDLQPGALDGIIGAEVLDDQLVSCNRLSLPNDNTNDEPLGLRSRAGSLCKDEFRNLLISKLPDHMTEMFRRI